MNDLFGGFTITDEMRVRAEENKEGLEADDLENKRTYGIAFCSHFCTQIKGDFDMWGNPDGDMSLMYVAWIKNLNNLSVIIDGDIRWDTVDEFLGEIEDCQNYIIHLEQKYKKSE